MEETLRYYFSAMFQGFAAIIALGAMYFLYFFEKIENQKKEIILELKPFAETGFKDYIQKYGLLNMLPKLYYLKKKLHQDMNQQDC